MPKNDDDMSLYVVRVEGGSRPDAVPDKTESMTLSDGLFLAHQRDPVAALSCRQTPRAARGPVRRAP